MIFRTSSGCSIQFISGGAPCWGRQGRRETRRLPLESASVMWSISGLGWSTFGFWGTVLWLLVGNAQKQKYPLSPTKRTHRWAVPVPRTPFDQPTHCDRLSAVGCLKVLAMDSVNKFKRSPKNERQFQGYQLKLPNRPRGAKSARWQLRNWQKSGLTWSALVLLAAGIGVISRILGDA